MGTTQQDTVHETRENSLSKEEVDSLIGSLVTDPAEVGSYGVVIEFLNERVATQKDNLLAKIRWLTGRWQGSFVYFALRNVRIL